MFMLFRLSPDSGRSLNIRTTRLLICGVLLNLPGLIQAADRDPATLTLPEAFARVLSDNPEFGDVSLRYSCSRSTGPPGRVSA